MTAASEAQTLDRVHDPIDADAVRATGNSARLGSLTTRAGAAALVAIAVVLSVAGASGTVSAQDAVPRDARSAAQRESIRSQREAAIVLYGLGGSLLTAGGFTTFSIAMPCVGRCEAQDPIFYASVAAATLGFILLVAAIGLGDGAHRRLDQFRSRGLSLAPGPGEVGVALAFAF